MQFQILTKSTFHFIPLIALFCASCAKDPEQRPSARDYSRTNGNAKVGARTLCVFMDGTANDYDSHTNVRRLYEMISARRDPKVICYYDHGVGSNELPLSGMIGGAGFSKNISQAFTFLRENYSKGRGDKIYLFGYSRGARQVQVLCDVLDECGLPPKSGEPSSYRTGDPALAEARGILLEYKKRRERRSKGEVVPPLNHQWPRPVIELVGNFECVESMANNVWRTMREGQLKNGSYQDHKYYPYTLPGNVKESYHALSLDEKRGLYEAIEWVRPTPTVRGQVIEEVWFAGAHGDVGGGYEESQSLSAFPLNWMIGKLDKHQLIPGKIRVHTDDETPGTNSSEFALAGKVLGKFRGDKPRNIQLWNDAYENPAHPGSLEYAEHHRVQPLVHQSVIDRMGSRKPISNADGSEPGVESSYRPDLFISYYSPQSPEGKRKVDFVKLRKDIQIVPLTR
jgi:Uncharacterized alpha/beta hydrolase domain (DUF2235)